MSNKTFSYTKTRQECPEKKAGNRVTRFLHLTCQKPPRQKLLTKERRAKSEQPRAKSEERGGKSEEQSAKREEQDCDFKATAIILK